MTSMKGSGTKKTTNAAASRLRTGTQEHDPGDLRRRHEAAELCRAAAWCPLGEAPSPRGCTPEGSLAARGNSAPRCSASRHAGWCAAPRPCGRRRRRPTAPHVGSKRGHESRRLRGRPRASGQEADAPRRRRALDRLRSKAAARCPPCTAGGRCRDGGPRAPEASRRVPARGQSRGGGSSRRFPCAQARCGRRVARRRRSAAVGCSAATARWLQV